MRVLARITPGTSWLPGQTVWGQGAPIQAHLAYMRQQYDVGAVLVGGPVRDGMSGMALLEVADLAAASDFAAADPAVAKKVLSYELLEVLPYFDAFEYVRSDGATRGDPAAASL